MQVEVAIPEKQVGKFHSGADVQIRVPAYPTKTFRGIVERISPEARSDEEGNFFTVTARVTDADYSKLKSGMSGKAKIHGETQRLGQKVFQPLIEFIRMKFWI
jgi:multidrug resistance efflux pump